MKEYYLDLLEPRLTLTENVDNLLFRREGLLRFIRSYSVFKGKRGANTIYQLVDFYTLFYFLFLHSNTTATYNDYHIRHQTQYTLRHCVKRDMP